MKNARQTAILRIISEKDVETQHQLIQALESEGVSATQATVSRDIKELHLIKEMSADGVYKYAVSQSREVRNNSARLRSIFRECVTSYVCAQNIVVLKTLPGLASAACSAIDGMGVHNFAGSIAGDDTAFLAMSDIDSAERFCVEIEAMLK
jgi:transcriptional regulator of arginine metabolism